MDALFCCCARYLASRCDDPLLLDRSGGGQHPGRLRSGAVRLQPASLTGSVLYSSPLSARSLSLSGRGKLADRGTVYTSKVRLMCFFVLVASAYKVIGAQGPGSQLNLDTAEHVSVANATFHQHCTHSS